MVLVEGHRKGEKKWVHNAPGKSAASRITLGGRRAGPPGYEVDDFGSPIQWKAAWDADFRAGFAAGKKMMARPSGKLIVASSAYNRGKISQRHGIEWKEGYRAAIDLDYNFDTKVVRRAEALGLIKKGRSARGRRDPMPPFRFLTTGESGWTKLNASTWRWVSAEGPEFMLRKPPNYGEWQVLYTPQAKAMARFTVVAQGATAEEAIQKARKWYYANIPGPGHTTGGDKLVARGRRAQAPTVQSAKWKKTKDFDYDGTYTVIITGTTGHKPGVNKMQFRNVFRGDGWWQLSLPVSSKGGPVKLGRNKKEAEKFLLWYRGASKKDRKLWEAGYSDEPDNAWGWNYETKRPETGCDR